MKYKQIKNRPAKKNLFLILSFTFSPPSYSEVTLDGSMGTAGSVAGPDYQITEDVGHRAGSNLFHSFGRFNINKTESATFSGSAGIKNVISRVTGGQASTIDGVFRSTIPNANIYFLNPSGVIFGENASLDVQGAFHASTADYLKFKDGVKFETGVATANPILITATPEAFGFLDNTPASISVLGETKTATLDVKKDATLSLIGGDITLKNGFLFTQSGQINLVSVGSLGEAIITDTAIGTTSFNKMGKISLVSNLPNHLSVGSHGDSAGKIFIRGGQMTMDNTAIFVSTEQGKGGDIDIGLTGDLNITNSQSNSKITLNISSSTNGVGDGGNINLKTAGLNLSQGSQINNLTSSIGKGGNININTTNTITLSGDAAGITSSTAGKGQSGNIRPKSCNHHAQ
ncbi:MAG: filamentous hemagglutinin N-terminal domain-containing protein [Methylococcaceae bacterium]|nr:filamentous hemagglutinin N-terminal domain-containing protein [Methylococcaceae bacterium]